MNVDKDQPARFDDRRGHIALGRPLPLLLPALAFIAGIILSEFLGAGRGMPPTVVFLVPIVAILVLGVLAARGKGNTHVLHAFVLVAALGVGYTRHQAAIRLPPDHVAHLATDEPLLTRLAGRIVTQPTTFPADKRNPFLPFDPSPRTRFVLAADELRTTDAPTAISGYIRVSVEAEGIEACMGDAVVVTGRLYRPRGPRNPGETDWARWNRSQNIYAGLSVEGAVYVQRIEEGGSTVRGLIGSLRAKAQSLLFEPFAQIESDQPTRLLDAMVLGHRSAAGRQLNEAFRRTGTSHFLAVSGFHVGVLAGSVWLLVRRVFQRSTLSAAVATIAVIVLYALIADPNAPILRAGIMGVLACIAQLARRPLLPLNWLGLAALCILACNPLQLFRPGFQLSFVLVFALFMIVPPVYRWVVFRNREGEVRADADTWPALFAQCAWRWFVGLAIASVCLWLNSVPLKLHHFGYLGLWSPLQSIIILPIVVVTIILGFLTLIAMGVFPALGAVFGTVLRASTGLLLWIVDKLSQLPGTFIETRRLPAWIAVATYSVGLLFLWHFVARKKHGCQEPRADKNRRRVALLSVCGAVVGIIWLGWLTLPLASPGRSCFLHVFSVGDGAATLLTTPENEAALFDAGTMYNFDAGQTVVQAARALGVRKLDLLAISHANFDHYSGVATVLGKLPTGRLVVNACFARSADEKPGVRRLLDMLPADSPPAAVWRAGDRFELGGVGVEVLWPPDDLDKSWKPNDRSLVVRIDAHGRSVMITGDIQRGALRALLDLHQAGRVDLKANVLIAPHHGSVVPGDTAAFYEAVSPELIVVSTGRERPKLEALVREALGPQTRVISTDDVGAVGVHLTAEAGLRVETPFAPGAE